MARYGKRGQRVQLLIKQGSAYLQRFVVTANGKADGAPRDITGKTIRAQIRKTPLTGANGAPTVTLTCTVTNGPAGEWAASLTATETGAIPAGETILDADSQYAWDAELVNSDPDDIEPLAYGLPGDVVVQAQVTR